MWLTKKDLEHTEPAEVAAFRSPIPTQMVSNGEFLPAPQTRQQREVEERIKELASNFGRKLGLNRREFLRTSSGMAAAFLAMNTVYGPVFSVEPAEAADPEAARARLTPLAHQFIFDDQVHFVRDDYTGGGGILRATEFAKNWNPVLKNEKLTLQRYKFENFVKEVFLDSETKVALLSGAPFDNVERWLLSNDQMARARALINDLASSRRLLCHALVLPGQPRWVEEVERAIADLKPDGWKGYTIGDPFNPASRYPWRLDDEKLMYPVYEKMVQAGIRNVSIHKGLLPPDYEHSFSNVWKYATVDDVGKAARDWPQLNFIIYHAAHRPFLEVPEQSLADFERTGRINWVSDLAEIPARYGVNNVYGELGTTFANSAVTHPKYCAALLGTLIKGLGADHVVWGTDSVWYGSPQWQIEAFRRIEIPEDMQKKYGFASLGAADGAVKGAILGYNSARLYNLNLRAAHTPLPPDYPDRLARMKAEYELGGAARSNAAYGFIRRRV
jgi:predicted TIM-barrel fold metal-dependent hydrolase